MVPHKGALIARGNLGLRGHVAFIVVSVGIDAIGGELIVGAGDIVRVVEMGLNAIAVGIVVVVLIGVASIAVVSPSQLIAFVVGVVRRPIDIGDFLNAVGEVVVKVIEGGRCCGSDALGGCAHRRCNQLSQPAQCLRGH
ncbi:hypothetical protein PN498_01110 [Oscillatoria sp. CS-180]|uniref:hypothetical protein n=1 Tax=Oscillatoria sp. CS-180 TaxID=3021720 RepID=UPI00232A7EAD|nr:hypothetical protein [Oscillatoria sp. CS-180]MDB9524572.1 hypothetical protein [Oscillatoria sp. CS-180]